MKQTTPCSVGERSLYLFRSALGQLRVSNGEDLIELVRFEEIEDAGITGAVIVRGKGSERTRWTSLLFPFSLDSLIGSVVLPASVVC